MGSMPSPAARASGRFATPNICAPALSKMPRRGIHSRASAESDPNTDAAPSQDRRMALAGMILTLLTPAADALAKVTEPKRTYYQELLESKPKLDISSVVKSKQGKAPKAQKKKFGAKPAASATGPSFNPVEVGLGLLAVGGAAAIGNAPSKAKAAGTVAAAKSRSPAPKPAPKAGTMRLGGTVAKAAPPPRPGTQKLGQGTKLKAAKPAPSKKAAAKGAPTKESGSNAGVVGVGLAGVALVGILAAGTVGKAPSAGEKAPAPATTTAQPAAVQVAIAPPPPPAAAPPTATVATAPVPEVKPQPAAPAPSKVAAPALALPTAAAPAPAAVKLPPTTGNNPLVIVGGGIATLIVAAAASGGTSSSDGSAAGSSIAPTPTSSDTPEARAQEARAWIDAWKAKQGKK